MKPMKGFCVLFTMLLVFGAFFPVTSAERDSLHVIITTDDKLYEEGDIILVEVRVYDKGQLADADTLQVTLDTRWQNPDIEVTMSPVSQGVYQGTYQIESEDRHAWFYAEAAKGTDYDSADLDIYFYYDSFELDIHFAHQSKAYAKPGDSLTATITSTYRNELVDVDEFSYVRLIDYDDAQTPLETTQVKTGVYRVSFDIPEITDSGSFELEARAIYANTAATAWAEIEIYVLTVWYRLDDVAGPTATFTMGVADLKGKAIPDAQITIEHPRDLTGTTGADGTTIFSLGDIHDGDAVYGVVSAQGRNQTFWGEIYLSILGADPGPVNWRFDVVYQGDKYLYDPGSSVSRTYKAYNYSLPLQNKEIHYYVTLERMDVEMQGGYLGPDDGRHIRGTAQIIKTGSKTTNEFGEFSINFNAPSSQGTVYIDFECGIPRHNGNYNPGSNPTYDHDDNLVYEEQTDSLFVAQGELEESSKISIESDPLKVGGKTKFTIKTDSLGEEDELFAKWMAGDPGSNLYMDFLGKSWVCWVSGANWIFLERGNDNEYTGESVIPSFMSDDDEYTIVAGSVDADTGYAEINHVSLKEGESAGTLGLEAVLLLLFIAILAFALFLIAIGTLASRKKKEGQKEILPPDEQLQDRPIPPPPQPEAPLKPPQEQSPPPSTVTVPPPPGHEGKIPLPPS